jgi:hypothetical protein
MDDHTSSVDATKTDFERAIDRSQKQLQKQVVFLQKWADNIGDPKVLVTIGYFVRRFRQASVGLLDRVQRWYSSPDDQES